MVCTPITWKEVNQGVPQIGAENCRNEVVEEKKSTRIQENKTISKVHM